MLSHYARSVVGDRTVPALWESGPGTPSIGSFADQLEDWIVARVDDMSHIPHVLSQLRLLRCLHGSLGLRGQPTLPRIPGCSRCIFPNPRILEQRRGRCDIGGVLGLSLSCLSNLMLP